MALSVLLALLVLLPYYQHLLVLAVLVGQWHPLDQLLYYRLRLALVALVVLSVQQQYCQLRLALVDLEDLSVLQDLQLYCLRHHYQLALLVLESLVALSVLLVQLLCCLPHPLHRFQPVLVVL